MSLQQKSAKSIYLSALELPANKREAYVLDECGDDSHLREEVVRLINNPAASSFLESPAAGLAITQDYSPVQEKKGSKVGDYRLMELIGEGGFGAVYVAEQHEPVRRKVAVKIIKPGMDTKEVIARFEAERQALALMDHPNIAKILEAGITDSGRPFFAMELIRGMSIVEYCDEYKLPTTERLKLFADVCRAVQHAHSKGVIHRDLKPSNILVSPHDGRPVVKIIDFGISKAIGQQLTVKTIYTRLHQMVGTPLYMSPEQAEINALDVDVRSDIYSLGVLLYELLTGTTPFDRERFSKAAYEEIKRIIREEEPPFPSNRLSSLGETLTTVSRLRSTEPGRLTASVKGELDWIVMCCLEKDRSRRYQTAAELASDVGRYLNDEAVQVVPPSAIYRTRKWIRRYRVPITLAAGYVLLSLVGLSTIYSAMQHAKTNERMARESERIMRQALENNRDLLLERALAAALSAEKMEYVKAIDDLKSLEIGSNDTEYLEALYAISNGEVDKTYDSMSRRVTENPDDIAAWSIRAILADSFYLDLNVDAEAVGRIRGREGKTPIERLLKTYAYPKDGVLTLRKIIAEKPGWGIARAMLARALCERAFAADDASQVAEAANQIKIAELLHPNNEFVKSIVLRVVTAEYVFATRESKSNERVSTLLDRGNALANQLNPRESTSPFGYEAVGEFYAATEQYDRSADVWEYLLTSRHAQAAAFFYVPMLLLLPDREPMWNRSDSLAGYYVLTGNRERAAADLTEHQFWTTNMGKAWMPNHLRMLGLDDQATVATTIAMQVTEGHAWWISNVARLTTGEWSEERLLASAGDDRWQRSHHLMVIALGAAR